MTTTQQDLLDFLNTLDPIPQDLINQLNKNPQATITRWMARTEAQWEKIGGDNGIDIYNHLHPSPQAALTASIELLNEGELSGTYNHYQNIGQALETNEMVRHVATELRFFVGENERSKGVRPFLFVEDSSGTGKTQLAFALRSALSKNGIRTLYLICSPIGDSSQLIYRVFTNISHAFQECIRRDLAEISSVNELSCTALSAKSLYTFGFIYQQMDINPPTFVKYEQRSASEVWSKLDNCQNYPVVILDEFPTIEGGNCNTLRLLRNSIRALKFGLLLMGTNSTAANLIDSNEQSRDVERYLWYSLYYRLPEVDINVIGLPSTCAEWMRGLIRYSRPLFAVTALECLKQYGDGSAEGMSVDDINSWLRDIVLRIVSQKRIFDNIFGRHGQVCLFLNISYHYTVLGRHNCPLIHQHFAHLEERVRAGSDDEFRIHLLNDLTLESDPRTKWNPTTRFPEPKDDILLFLCLMGTRDFNPFRNGSGKDISFRQAVQEIGDSRRSNEVKLIYDNAIQISNDGMFLEAILASCLCVASRSNGIGGVCLEAFICSVFSHAEKQKELKTYSLKMPGNAPESLLTLLANFIIPNLAPPNQKWPECVQSIPQGRFGQIFRSRNQNRLDLTTDFGLTGESKDQKVKIQTMREIIERIPKTSKVHIVFVRTLQSSYFGRSSFACEFPDRRLSFCVVKAYNSYLKLSEINGLPNIHSFDNNSTLVIFYLSK